MLRLSHNLFRLIAFCLTLVHITIAYSRPRPLKLFEYQNFGNLFTDKHLRNETLLDITDYEPVVFSKKPLHSLNIDSFGKPEDWAVEKEYKGYEIKSDGQLPIKAQTFRFRNQRGRTIRIRIGKIGSARYVEGRYRKRVLELKVTNWNSESRFRIKVPFGVTAQDLKIMEGSQYVDIFAPASVYE